MPDMRDAATFAVCCRHNPFSRRETMSLRAPFGVVAVLRRPCFAAKTPFVLEAKHAHSFLSQLAAAKESARAQGWELCAAAASLVYPDGTEAVWEWRQPLN